MTIHDAGAASLGSVEPSETADADLVLRSRSGDRAAFAELWRRHYPAGVTVARAVTSSLDPDDLVQEAFTHIYRSILTGGGPTGSFRAYLFTSIRNTAATWGRARRETAIDALESLEDPRTTEQATSDALDRGLTHQAFRSLPTRWQEVLWYSEIEQMKPAEIAPLLGMKPTAVAQLTFRAREGLREAWIQAHLRSVADASMCQWTIDHLGAYERATISRRDRVKVEAHLGECTRCSIVASEAHEVSRRLAIVLLPLTVGSAAAAGYLASLQGGGVPVMALAAMPSSVMQGAVTILPGATGAGAAGATGAGTAGVAGSTAAGATAAGAATSTAAGAGAAGAAATAAAGAGAAGAGVAGAAAVTAGAAAAGGIFSSVSVLAGLATAGLVVVTSVVAGAVGLPMVQTTPTPNEVTSSISAEQPAVTDDTGGSSIDDASADASPQTDSVAEDPGATVVDDGSASEDSEPAPVHITPTASAAPGQLKTTPPPGQVKTDAPTAEEKTNDAPGQSARDGKATDSGAALPAASLAIASSTSYPAPESDGTTLAVTVTGVPGAAVELRIRGTVMTSAAIGDDGTAVLLAQPTAQDLKADARVEIRYVDGKSTGAPVSAKLSALL